MRNHRPTCPNEACVNHTDPPCARTRCYDSHRWQRLLPEMDQGKPVRHSAHDVEHPTRRWVRSVVRDQPHVRQDEKRPGPARAENVDHLEDDRRAARPPLVVGGLEERLRPSVTPKPTKMVDFGHGHASISDERGRFSPCFLPVGQSWFLSLLAKLSIRRADLRDCPCPRIVESRTQHPL